MNIKNKALNLLSMLKNNWKTPAEGRYMSLKEIVSLSGGGIGVRFVVYCISQMIISTGNTLLGNTIGITPEAIYIIYIISLITSVPLTALRANLIDNTRSMKGKYRPYIITMGIPSVILGIGFIMMPYENMSLVVKCITVLLFNIGFQFFYNFYLDAYDSLINVLSPNSIERSDVLSVRCIVENLSPSIAGIFLPIVAKWITGDETLYDLRIYRTLFPAMIFVGFLISVVVYVNTEEKIVQAKTHVITVRFSDALRAVARNKYFWIISLAGWLGFLESAFGSIMGWMYSYQKACSAAQYSIITAIAGNASFWPNIVAPFAIRKYGKKKILIFTNILNVGLIACMLPVVRMTGSAHIIWILLICTFINQFISSLGHFLTPCVNADIRDYQQYISGERIDGMFAAVGLIGNIISVATGSVLPMIYSKAGLNEATAVSLGYSASNVYDVLYNHDYFVSISSVLIVASIIGAVMNVLPYFFYNFTETNQKSVVSVLKIRALFEDYNNGNVDNEKLNETMTIIREARIYAEKEPQTPDRNAVRVAKKSKNKDAVRAAKQNYKAQKEENEKIEIAAFVMAELNRYSTDYGRLEIAAAEKILTAGINGSYDSEIFSKNYIKSMPKNTAAEKQARSDFFALLRDIKTSRKTKAKYFPDGVTEFDASVFDVLFKQEDETEQALHDALKAKKAANERKEDFSVYNQSIRNLQKRKKEIQAQIKKATNDNSLYYRAAKPYLDAKRTLQRMKNYAEIDKIIVMSNEQ
ncbi:MAG: MFS transporter [Clostridia bacterium]|nr:MFS transporter [Clostridia bacterium]